MKRFDVARLQIENYSPAIVLVALVNGICYTHLRLIIGKYKLTFLEELLKHIDKYTT